MVNQSLMVIFLAVYMSWLLFMQPRLVCFEPFDWLCLTITEERNAQSLLPVIYLKVGEASSKGVPSHGSHGESERSY